MRMDRQIERREAALSLELHLAVLPYLKPNWPENERIIRRNLALMKRQPRAPLARGWVHEWERATDEGPEAIARVALTPGERGEDLRQMSPLAGVLPEEVRLQVLHGLRDHERHER